MYTKKITFCVFESNEIVFKIIQFDIKILLLNFIFIENNSNHLKAI